MSDLVGNPEDKFSCALAHIIIIVLLKLQQKSQSVAALYEPQCDKTGLRGVSDQVPHKLGCTTTEDG